MVTLWAGYVLAAPSLIRRAAEAAPREVSLRSSCRGAPAPPLKKAGRVAPATLGLRATLALALLVPAAAGAQSVAPEAPAPTGAADWTAPRTPWGAPDLQGVWDYRTATPLERPRQFAGRETMTAAEAAEYERRHSERLDDYDRSPSVHAKWWLDNGRELTADRRTSLLVDPPDGRIPGVTEDAKRRAAERNERRRQRSADAAEYRGLTERCITFGMPRFPGAYNNNYHILQTPTHVAIVAEMIHDARIVPLDGRPHLGADLPQWHGDSRGYYDGDTLVVETVNFSPKSAFRGSTTSLRLVERFTRVGPETVNYEITVADPATWTTSWTALVPMTKTDQAVYEYACHEGNLGLRNILHNARYEEDPDYAGKLPAPGKSRN